MSETVKSVDRFFRRTGVRKPRLSAWPLSTRYGHSSVSADGRLPASVVTDLPKLRTRFQPGVGAIQAALKVSFCSTASNLEPLKSTRTDRSGILSAQQTTCNTRALWEPGRPTPPFRLYRGDVDLLHRHDGVECALGRRAIRIRYRRDEGARGALPRQSPPILALAARRLLTDARHACAGARGLAKASAEQECLVAGGLFFLYFFR